MRRFTSAAALVTSTTVALGSCKFARNTDNGDTMEITHTHTCKLASNTDNGGYKRKYTLSQQCHYRLVTSLKTDAIMMS